MKRVRDNTGGASDVISHTGNNKRASSLLTIKVPANSSRRISKTSRKQVNQKRSTLIMIS